MECDEEVLMLAGKYKDRLTFSGLPGDICACIKVVRSGKYGECA